MKGQMMKPELTTHSIIEFANRVFPYKKISSKLPDGSWHRYTYADLYKRTKKLASALVSVLGVEPGDRVATFAWNHFQHMELYYAIPGAGAVCHTVNVRLSIKQISQIINHAKNKIVFVDASLVPLMERVAPTCPHVKYFVVLNASNFTSNLSNIIFYEDLLEKGSEHFAWAEVKEDDACALSYTSGTTGDPKGALYSHRSTYLHAITTMAPNAINMSANDTALLIVPQFHVMAWGYPYMCLLAGADIVLPSLHLQPQALIEIIIQEKVTKANGVPTVWIGVYEELKKNFSGEKITLKEYAIGGSAVPSNLIKGFEDDFGASAVQVWGMTEISPLATVSRLQSIHENETEEQKLLLRTKQGVELPGIELRMINDEEELVSRDGIQTGEFQIRGSWVISSYYNMENNHEHFSEEGWFKTGDVGTIDAQGYMMITDRKKDLIKSGGEWISSVELELALMSHSKIQEASVIAIPDPKWKERPLACVVFKKGELVSKEELKKFLSGNFANYQIPDLFITMDEIPKTSVGKFDKKHMRSMYAKGEYNAVVI